MRGFYLSSINILWTVNLSISYSFMQWPMKMNTICKQIISQYSVVKFPRNIIQGTASKIKLTPIFSTVTLNIIIAI